MTSLDHFAAIVGIDWAEAHLARGEPGDRECAGELLREAEAEFEAPDAELALRQSARIRHYLGELHELGALENDRFVAQCDGETILPVVNQIEFYTWANEYIEDNCPGDKDSPLLKHWMNQVDQRLDGRRRMPPTFRKIE